MDAEYQLRRVRSAIVGHIEEDLIWLNKVGEIIDELVDRSKRPVDMKRVRASTKNLKNEVEGCVKHKKMLLEIWKG